MKLEEIQGSSFSEELYVVIELPEELVPSDGLLNEGRWVESGKKDLMYRVDPARPETNQLRHVHVAHAKHTGAKNQQASWNDDTTRHDKGSFNEKFGSKKNVQAVAREALGLDASVVLEEFMPKREKLNEGNTIQERRAIYLRILAV